MRLAAGRSPRKPRPAAKPDLIPAIDNLRFPRQAPADCGQRDAAEEEKRTKEEEEELEVCS